MAVYTDFLNLEKPDGNDPASQVPFNNNADILDAKIQELTQIVGEQWTLLSTQSFTISNSCTLFSMNESYYEYDELLLSVVITSATGAGSLYLHNSNSCFYPMVYTSGSDLSVSIVDPKVIFKKLSSQPPCFGAIGLGGYGNERWYGNTLNVNINKEITKSGHFSAPIIFSEDYSISIIVSGFNNSTATATGSAKLYGRKILLPS